MSAASDTAPEFSRVFDLRQADGRRVVLEARADERTQLARRFALIAIDRLAADVLLQREGDGVRADGTLDAAVVQSCAVSGEDLAATIAEPFTVRFVPPRAYQPDAEIELDAADCDEIELSGTGFDLGEAVAQSLALAIDPFAAGPAAEAARHDAGLTSPEAGGPFAALAALRSRD